MGDAIGEIMTKTQVRAKVHTGAVFINRHTLAESTIVRSVKTKRKGTRVVVSRRVPYPPYTVEREIAYRAFLQNYTPKATK